MQPYELRYKPWRYLQQAVEVDRMDVAVLTEELTEIYSTPTPKGWPEPKKVIDLYLIDWLFLTIAEVWYLYPESKHESYSITICYKFSYEGEHSKFQITWTLIFPFL